MTPKKAMPAAKASKAAPKAKGKAGNKPAASRARKAKA